MGLKSFWIFMVRKIVEGRHPHTVLTGPYFREEWRKLFSFWRYGVYRRMGMSKYLCRIIGCNHKACAATKWYGDTLFQGFRCSRCKRPSLYWGYVTSSRECSGGTNQCKKTNELKATRRDSEMQQML